jgi:hypothetical protein
MTTVLFEVEAPSSGMASEVYVALGACGDAPVGTLP